MSDLDLLALTVLAPGFGSYHLNLFHILYPDSDLAAKAQGCLAVFGVSCISVEKISSKKQTQITDVCLVLQKSQSWKCWKFNKALKEKKNKNTSVKKSSS